MKSIKARDLQHDLSRVLDRVERGETVQILRRNRPVARIVPIAVPPRPKPWPDLVKRLHAIYGDDRIASPASGRIYQDRGEA